MQRACSGVLRVSARALLRQRVCRVISVRHMTSEENAYQHGRFRSDAEQRIAEVPPIEVEGYTAICDGGSGVNGHPIEYIQLDNVTHNRPSVCKYCGLRYVSKAKHHH